MSLRATPTPTVASAVSGREATSPLRDRGIVVSSALSCSGATQVENTCRPYEGGVPAGVPTKQLLQPAPEEQREYWSIALPIPATASVTTSRTIVTAPTMRETASTVIPRSAKGTKPEAERSLIRVGASVSSQLIVVLFIDPLATLSRLPDERLSDISAPGSSSIGGC